MEAFESFVALALESEGFVVSEALKFPVALHTQKAAYDEVQTHGFEVDLVAARADRLVLATVKSFFGSRSSVALAQHDCHPLMRAVRLDPVAVPTGQLARWIYSRQLVKHVAEPIS